MQNNTLHHFEKKFIQKNLILLITDTYKINYTVTDMHNTHHKIGAKMYAIQRTVNIMENMLQILNLHGTI